MIQTPKSWKRKDTAVSPNPPSRRIFCGSLSGHSPCSPKACNVLYGTLCVKFGLWRRAPSFLVGVVAFICQRLLRWWCMVSVILPLSSYIHPSVRPPVCAGDSKFHVVWGRKGCCCWLLFWLIAPSSYFLVWYIMTSSPPNESRCPSLLVSKLACPSALRPHHASTKKKKCCHLNELYIYEYKKKLLLLWFECMTYFQYKNKKWILCSSYGIYPVFSVVLVILHLWFTKQKIKC